jgi:ribosomal protein S18 acetylase RimI-like enzyme
MDAKRDIAVRTVGVVAAPVAARILVASHAEYPAFRHLINDPAGRRRALRPFMLAAARDAARHGRCDVAFDGTESVGAALWMPPGRWPASARRKLRMMPGITRAMVIAGRAARAWSRTGAALERDLGSEHAWYLLALGVHPDVQRCGVGRRLLLPVIEEATAAGLPCVLHTSDPANIPYYERFGFGVVRSLSPLFANGPAYLSMRT